MVTDHPPSPRRAISRSPWQPSPFCCPLAGGFWDRVSRGAPRAHTTPRAPPVARVGKSIPQLLEANILTCANTLTGHIDQLIAINWGGFRSCTHPQLIPDALVVAYVPNLSPFLMWIALAGFWGFLALNVEGIDDLCTECLQLACIQCMCVQSGDRKTPRACRSPCRGRRAWSGASSGRSATVNIDPAVTGPG